MFTILLTLVFVLEWLSRKQICYGIVAVKRLLYRNECFRSLTWGGLGWLNSQQWMEEFLRNNLHGKKRTWLKTEGHLFWTRTVLVFLAARLRAQVLGIMYGNTEHRILGKIPRLLPELHLKGFPSSLRRLYIASAQMSSQHKEAF